MADIGRGPADTSADSGGRAPGGAPFASLSDDRLALALSAVLFVALAYPLLLTEVPPYQDLPNHLATATVLREPERFPEFVSNGYLKTNAALFAWLAAVGGPLGLAGAAKAFVALVLAVGSLVLPRFLLAFGGRARMVVGTLLGWPMIHNWFVCMGMLDFALGVPLALYALVLVARQRVAPEAPRGVALAALGVVIWYAHAFALLVLLLLVTLHLLRGLLGAREVGLRTRTRAMLVEARRIVVPLVPAGLLVSYSLLLHATEPHGQMTGFVEYGAYLPPWELVYNVWAEWGYGFTALSASSVVPTVILALVAWTGRRGDVPFFSPLAFAVVGLIYVFAPYITTNWFHVNSRFIPFLWAFALVRAPARLPRALPAVLVASFVAYAAGLGVDFVRLDRERARFVAGIAKVPEGANLLPLVFRHKMTSDNTRNLLHLWVYYVVEKKVHTPLFFAHSRSFPILYTKAPDVRFNHLVVEGFALSMTSPAWPCAQLKRGGIVADCEALYREEWREFWAAATPEYDHVLTWAMPEAASALVPPSYRVVWRDDLLAIYARDGAGTFSPVAR